MLREMVGDILNVKDGIICHQVNYFGTMGGGLAAAIADRILTDEQYNEYVRFCEMWGRRALGKVQFLKCSDTLIVANLFCQDEVGAAIEEWKSRVTDYDHMAECFYTVWAAAYLTGKTVYIPRNIGCGIAGGDWDAVKHIIQDAFMLHPVEAYIVGRKRP